jgi:capsular exopolysaccharide synthesis family protein
MRPIPAWATSRLESAIVIVREPLPIGDFPLGGFSAMPPSDRPHRSQGDHSGELARDLAVLWRRRWLIVSITVIVVGAAFAFTFLRTPVYTATAKVLVKPTGINIANVGAAGVDRLVSLPTEAELVRSSDVAGIAAEALGRDPSSARDLLSHVGVNVPTNSQILEIRYTDTEPQVARDGSVAFANAYLQFKGERAIELVGRQQADYEAQIEALQAQIQDLNEIIADNPGDTGLLDEANNQKQQLQSQITILQLRIVDEVATINTDPGSLVSSPDVPTSPSSPNHQLELALGLFAGLFLGVGAAFLRARTDTRISERIDLEAALGAPVLAIVPRIESWRNRKQARLVSLEEAYDPATEAYRVLRPVLLTAAADRGEKVIMVVSPTAGDGKTTTVANLGVVLAQTDRRVTLVSADLRRPRLHEFFGMPMEPGVTDVLMGRLPWQEAVRDSHATSGLRVLPAGKTPERPAEILQSGKMRRLLDELRDSADFVLLDCPPILPVADSLELAPLVDAVLFVADARSTTRQAVIQARTQLAHMRVRVMGAVLNGVDPKNTRSGYGYGYGYAPEVPDYSENGFASERTRESATRRPGARSRRRRPQRL